MKNANRIHVFVSGGTQEDVKMHFGSLLQYIRDVSFAKYHPESDIKINRVFENQSPTNMTFVVFGPQIPDISAYAKTGIPLTVELHHYE